MAISRKLHTDLIRALSDSAYSVGTFEAAPSGAYSKWGFISSAEKPSVGPRRIVNIVVTVESQRVIGLVFKVN